MLRVFLAGGVRVECDGDAIDDRLLGGRQGRRLLAHMAWEGRSVHRDELADGLWSGVLPRTWERTLSGVVTRLRVGLAEAGVRGEVISFVDGRYGLVGGGEVHLDVVDASANLVAARQAADCGDLERARVLAESVLVVARLPLMPGEDAGWVDAARARHRILLFDALDLLADSALAAHWYALGEAAAREAVHWDPLREVGHQRLLRVLSAKGDRAAALTAYSAWRRLLADELGVDPSPETESIYVGLLGSEPVAADTSWRDVGLAAPGAREAFPSALLDHVTSLVGREPALVWLWSLWRKARVDAPLIAVIHGPPGAGKKSLAAVFAREVYATGAAVVYSARNDNSSAVSSMGSSAPALVVLDHVEQRASLSSVGGAALVVVLSPTCAFRARCDAELALAPLDRWSVSAVFEDRLGRSPSDAELDEMCSLTGGWPGAVVAEISVRQDARARALSFDAASAAASLVAANHDLADELLRRRPLSTPVSSPAGGSAPYKGLLRFEPEDADLFFGREQLVSDLLAGVSAGRLLAVVGASGSGKSSLVRAGLVAELRRGALPGSDRWPVVLLTPGRNPSVSLAACLRAATDASPTAELRELVDRFSRGPPSVVVVDQFEELFTLGADRAEQDRFVDALLACESAEGCECRVVVALRSDFYGACTNLPALAVALARSQIVVPPPSDVELRRMVALPARAASVMLESGLVDEVVADVANAPGALPLMSTALLEAWGRRINGVVTLDAYRAAGGVRGAIATLAESVWEAFDPTERRLARSMLLRLAGTNDAADDVGTPVERVELGGPGDVTAAQVLGQLVKRRLVTVDAGNARIAHEAVLREWPRLRGWLDDDRATRDVLHHLRTAAADWQQRGADRADLYRGTRLAAALDLDSEIELSERERSFLAASTDLRTSEADSLRRRTRRQWALSAGLVVLLVLASIAGVTAVGRQRQATDRARVATAQRLTQQAGSATGLDLRLLLAVEARRLDDSPEARGALLGQLTQANAVTAFLRAGAANLSAVAMSPDGSMLATGGADGTVSLWRLPGDELFKTVRLLDGRVRALVFSADGEVAAGGDNGDVARWTLDAAKPIRFRAHASSVLAVAYGSGHSLLTAGADGLLRAFSVSTGQELWSRSTPVGAVTATFDPNGSTYVQAQPDGSLSVVEIAGSSSVLAGAPDTNDTVSALALSANGHEVALGTSSGIVKVLDRDSGTTSDLGRVSSQAGVSSLDGVDALVFTPSGEVLATAGGSIARLNIADSDNREPLQLVGGRVTGLAVDPSGETATAVTETGETVLFALRRPGLGRPLANAGQPVTALTVAQGQLVVAAGDGQVAVWDTASDHRRVLPMRGHPVTAIAASGDGTLLAVLGRDVIFNGVPTSTTYAVVDAKTGRLLVEAAWYPNTVAATAVALQPAGTLLAIGDEHGGQVRLFEATTGRPVRDLNSPGAAIAALAFTPSGQELVGVTTDGVVVRWDAQGLPIGQPIELGSNASALAMAPDGNRIAVATASGALIVDLATDEVGAGLTSPFGRIESVAFGLDGTVLATGGSGRVILWDVPTRRPLGNAALPAPGNTAVAFDTTGRKLITGGDDGEVIVWPIDPDRWVEMACNLAGRTLTPDEWHRYLGGRPYHPTCR